MPVPEWRVGVHGADYHIFTSVGKMSEESADFGPFSEMDKIMLMHACESRSFLTVWSRMSWS